MNNVSRKVVNGIKRYKLRIVFGLCELFKIGL